MKAVVAVFNQGFLRDYTTSKFTKDRLKLYFRLSSRRSVEAAHPRLGQDVFTSSGAKELVARHLDSYLHCLAAVSGAAGVVTKLRRLQPTVFRQLVALRRPRDELGARWIQQTSIIISTAATCHVMPS